MAETSKTVHHAARVLEELRSGGPVPASELARRLALSRTVVTRLINTLESHDLVRRTGAGIELGFGLLDLARGLAPGLRDIARPHLHELAITFHETAVLAVADGDSAVAVDQVVPDRRVVRIHYRAGTRHSLLAAAHGRAMLAFAHPALIAGLTGGEAEGALGEELRRIRRDGYAVSHDELEQGVAGLASPILDGEGMAMASLGIVAPVARFPAKDRVAGAVRDAARLVTIELAEDHHTSTSRRSDRREHALLPTGR